MININKYLQAIKIRIIRKGSREINFDTFPLAILCLLLISRSVPSDPKTTKEVVEKASPEAVEESCEGVGDEECLMRRTLSAHIDYIYTQGKKP
ncbi:phytosulfokines-like [Dioscorea cayenensis subsp. rotundata]|uniref:Phytosulfokine n=1 Tax=Dioscorea cayennensis subsp. rotundata TaxID=55577 RepID=A0AB40CBU2_DIOCR|nr:phytosulfokines-like [Dioscorea cayenensis subsp. rotundata]